MLRIGIDARFYGVNAGIGRYLRNLISELEKIDRTNEYYLFLLPEYLKKLPLRSNYHVVEADFPWYGFSEQIKFPKLLKRYSLDLVHFPHFNVPIFYNGKFIVTIHDLTHFDFKMKRATTRNLIFYELKHNVYKKVMSYAIKKSKKIITVSNFVRGEILKRWKVDSSKIEVIPEAVEEGFIKKAKTISKKEIDKTLKRFGVKKPFIYYIGSAHPHKNVEGLIEAFLTLRKKYNDLSLVLAGQDDYFWKKIKGRFTDKGILFLGYIKDEESTALFRSSTCYVQPSFNEGFGLTLLEAMCCGCPVVSSKNGSLPEISGEAALYFDPSKNSDIVDKVSEVLNDSILRQKLKNLGETRFKKFSFSKMAADTLKVYNKT